MSRKQLDRGVLDDLMRAGFLDVAWENGFPVFRSNLGVCVMGVAGSTVSLTIDDRYFEEEQTKKAWNCGL